MKNRKKFIGIALSGIGVAMFVIGLSTFSTYYLGVTIPAIPKLIFGLFSIFLGSTFFTSFSGLSPNFSKPKEFKSSFIVRIEYLGKAFVLLSSFIPLPIKCHVITVFNTLRNFYFN